MGHCLGGALEKNHAAAARFEEAAHPPADETHPAASKGRIEELGNRGDQVQPTNQGGNGFCAESSVAMSLIESGTTAAELDRSPEQSAKSQRLAPRDDPFTEPGAVASELQAPAQIDVLADGKFLVESADVLERVAPHRHVAGPRCIEKTKLRPCGRGAAVWPGTEGPRR